MAKDICRHCKKKPVSRRGLGTCGKRACLAAEQRAALYGDPYSTVDPRHDGGHGMRIKIDGRGSVKNVIGSGTKGGKHFYRLQGGGTVEASRAEVQD
jgi:hypothetical protein